MDLYQGWTLTFKPTCPIGQVTVKFYLAETENYLSKVLLTSNMHDQYLAKYYFVSLLDAFDYHVQYRKCGDMINNYSIIPFLEWHLL